MIFFRQAKIFVKDNIYDAQTTQVDNRNHGIHEEAPDIHFLQYYS